MELGSTYVGLEEAGVRALSKVLDIAPGLRSDKCATSQELTILVVSAPSDSDNLNHNIKL